MVKLSLEQVTKLTGGQLLRGNPETTVLSWAFDSRQAGPGSLFFALKNKRDGHDYVRDAYEKGAIAACISEVVSGLPPDFGLIKVADPLKALQTLAARVVQQASIKIVGITGSLGKTTTKEFIARLLSEKFKVLKSPGNFNNQLGVPISILSMDSSHEIAVLEMGTSRPGEIKQLTQIAPPDIAVITGIAPVHLEFFQNLEEIALAKKEILDGAREGALAVLRGDDPLVRKIAADYPQDRVFFFGCHEDCLIRAENLKYHGLNGLSFDLIYGQDKAPVKLPLLNQALVSDFLAACAVSFSLGLKLAEISPAFSDLPETEHRGRLLQFENGIKIYDDSYNSNPVALTEVLKSLGQIPAQRKIAVLGDMLELGPQEIDFHREVGRKIVKYGWDVLVTVGEKAKYLAEGAVDSGLDPNFIFSFSEATRAGSWLESFIQAGDFILIKGSRGLAMDQIVSYLKKVMEK